MRFRGLFQVLLETRPSENLPKQTHTLTRTTPLILVGLGLAISLFGVALIPDFSPISTSYTTSMPVCATGLFVLLVGVILIFIFYLRRQKKK